MEKLLCFPVRKHYFVFSRVQQRFEAKSIHEISIFLLRMNILFKMPSWIWPLYSDVHSDLKKDLKPHLKISKYHCIKYKDIKTNVFKFE